MSYTERVEYSWKQLPNASKKIPSVRCNMSGGMYNDHLWLLMGAGAGSGRSSEVWKFDIKKGEWSPVVCTGEAPTPRDGHSATYVGSGKFLSFGGQGTPSANNKAFRSGEQASKTRTLCAREVFNELHEFDCDTLTWSAIHPTGGPPPTSRRLHTANYISYQSTAQPGLGEERSVGTFQSLANKSAMGGSFAKSQTVNGSLSGQFNQKNDQHPVTITGVPNNSLLIYGGCGIEPSKKSEQVYNDLWAYVLDTRTWVQMQSKGAIPRPQSGHKSELIGDILVIVGGIAATPFTLSKSDQVLSASLASITSDVMTLNIRTLTWTYLDLRDTVGRTVKLNLHGHSITADTSTLNNTDILIFGGKDALDTRGLETKRISSNRHFCRLNVSNGTVSPLATKDIPPENRYGHIAVSLETESPVQDPFRGGRHNSNSNSKTESIMLIYGGSSLEAGGFLEPEVFAFMRTIRYESTDEASQNNKGPKGPGEQQRSVDSFGTGGFSARRSGASRRSFESVRSSNRSQRERGSELSHAEGRIQEFPECPEEGVGMDDMGDNNGNYNGNNNGNYDGDNDGNNNGNERDMRKTIWQRIYDKGFQNGGIAVTTSRQPTDSWADLKLALSYPTTERDSFIRVVPPIIYPSSLNNKNGKNNKNKLDIDSIPDAIRIGLNLDHEIKDIEYNMNKYKSSRESRAAKLLIGENHHNLQNSQSFREENGMNPTFKMLQTLGTGKGTKSLLNLENEDLKQKMVSFKKLGLQNSQSTKLIPEDVMKINDKKIKNLSKKLLPLVRGMKKSEAKVKYLEEYPLEEVDDWNKQTTIMLKQALSLNLSLNY